MHHSQHHQLFITYILVFLLRKNQNKSRKGGKNKIKDQRIKLRIRKALNNTPVAVGVFQWFEGSRGGESNKSNKSKKKERKKLQTNMLSRDWDYMFINAPIVGSLYSKHISVPSYSSSI